jgi:hypothetical protein
MSKHASRITAAGPVQPAAQEQQEIAMAADTSLFDQLEHNPELAIMVTSPPIASHRAFVEITGSATAALLLSACLQEQEERGSDADGWFLASFEMWHQRTGLSRKEQATARKLLREASLLQERKEGFPANFEVRIMYDQVSCRLIEVAAARCAREASSAKSATAVH